MYFRPLTDRLHSCRSDVSLTFLIVKEIYFSQDKKVSLNMQLGLSFLFSLSFLSSLRDGMMTLFKSESIIPSQDSARTALVSYLTSYWTRTRKLSLSIRHSTVSVLHFSRSCTSKYMFIQQRCLYISFSKIKRYRELR